jgi:uncharacterized protein (DUF2147 family)
LWIFVGDSVKRLFVLIFLLLAPVAVLADPVTGLWRTEPDDGRYAHVRMGYCDRKICGVIEETFDTSGPYRSANIGRQLVIDMVPRGAGRYRGRVWRPSTNKIYIGRMDLEGDRLKLFGCVAGGLFCASQTWVRID